MHSNMHCKEGVKLMWLCSMGKNFYFISFLSISVILAGHKKIIKS